MALLAVLRLVALPLALVIAGVVAVRMAKEEERRPKGWRDDSLAEWYRERDRIAEEERRRRAAALGLDELEGTESREDEQTERQERIGG